MTVPPQPPAGRHGHQAASPFAIPAAGWKDVLIRTWKEAGEDNVGLISAGVAFYGFLAMVPLLGAIVLSYGLIADPSTVMGNIRSLTAVMPADAAKLIGEQLINVVTASDGKKGFGLLIAIGVAFYGAMKGAGAVVTALNVAYEEEEKRGFVKLNLVTLAITVGAVLMAILAMVAIAALGHLAALFPHAPGVLLAAGKIISYLLMAAVGAGAAAALYRFAPSRDEARWVWLTPGSVAVTLLWLGLTLGFGIYVANFGNYNATYGSLGAVVVLLTWLYLSAYILVLGGELNSELEHQTARDTTAGPERPLGARGARVADTVAEGTTPEPAMGATASPMSDQSPSAGRAMASDLATARIAARGSGLLGGRRVGMAPSLFATGGLALLRREGRAGAGVALVAVAAGLAWLSRERR